MKKLMLDNNLKTRLSRLLAPARELSYLGSDPQDLLKQPAVAIVGTRKPTPYGKAVTQKLAEELARAGVVVISGNALGVDVLAQQSATDAGGKVISVLPSGLDNIYPATNRDVAKTIAKQGGALMSEYEPGHVPTRYDFLERNRLIAALSDLVVVPEAARRSGSLNTASHAANMGIPVACVPGPISAPMSAGTNQLIKDGAHLITGSEDIISILGIKPAEKELASLEGENNAQTILLKLIADGVADSISLQSLSKLETSDFHMAVSMLEVEGRIEQIQPGEWQLS